MSDHFLFGTKQTRHLAIFPISHRFSHPFTALITIGPTKINATPFFFIYGNTKNFIRQKIRDYFKKSLFNKNDDFFLIQTEKSLMPKASLAKK